MSTINIGLRLRPIRFAFLVRPNDSKRALEIFRINTCLWGGQYNPIIPFFKALPRWWNRTNTRFENARQVLNGYLDFFEPDFLVEGEEGLAEGLGFDTERILKPSALLAHAGERDKDLFGLNVFDLYRDLYHKEFQFQRRQENRIIHATANEKAFEALAACVFGAFPAETSLDYLFSAYKNAFDPINISLSATTFSEIFERRYVSALQIGKSELEIHYNDHQAPTLFILDAHQTRDLIDYWNLRAVFRHVLPIPIQWVKELSPFCKQFIRNNYRPLPRNPHGVMIRPVSMFSRSIGENIIDEVFQSQLCIEENGANTRQDWYPPFWRKPSEMMVRTTRPTLDAGSKAIDVQMDEDEPTIRFDPLYPEFASEYGNRVRWANVVRMREWGMGHEVATVFPCNYRNPSYPKFRAGETYILPTTEGLITFPQYKNLYASWTLSNGLVALNEWLKENEIEASPSDAGRATQQIIQTLRGFWGVRSLASRGIIELLNEMSRRPITRSAHHLEFQNKINVSVSEDVWGDRYFETLVDNKAVELGLELKCNKCGNWSWYTVSDLDYSMICHLCRKHFDFPVQRPGDSKLSRWAYRVIGPFALPDYARGGYAAALAIRFFADVVGSSGSSEVTWSSGQELRLPSGGRSEADFILWYQRKGLFSTDHPTEIVFGEAKSYGGEAFKSNDIDRMKLLAETFPGSTIVFATLKEAGDLSSSEVGRIRRLAYWGREYDEDRNRSRAPVIVLTATELFSAYSLDMSWQQIGGKHAELIEPGWVRTDNLRNLANLTQQLYLGMDSYWDWREERWKMRSARRKKA